MNLDLLRPEICLAITAVAAIVADLLFKRKEAVTIVSLLGIGVAALLTLSILGKNPQTIGNGLFALDNYALFFTFLFLGLAFMVILASVDYVSRMSDFHGEFHALILTVALGAILTAAATDIISILLSVELTAISFYALVGFLKDGKASESSLKYILLGAVNSAILLYGLAMLFGFSGSTRLAEIAQAVSNIPAQGINGSAGLLFGLVLVCAGFGFKIAAVRHFSALSASQPSTKQRWYQRLATCSGRDTPTANEKRDGLLTGFIERCDLPFSIRCLGVAQMFGIQRAGRGGRNP
ncbi:MAG: proton-conducting transporter membrane subunit, partial [Dehalococcoidales bacterium]